jgi:cytochrome c oxidase cbb3-type subunit IV
MDTNDLRSIVTVVSLVLFLGIVRWAWSRANASRFAEAANLPFADEAAPPPAAAALTKPSTQEGNRP